MELCSALIDTNPNNPHPHLPQHASRPKPASDRLAVDLDVVGVSNYIRLLPPLHPFDHYFFRSSIPIAAPCHPQTQKRVPRRLYRRHTHHPARLNRTLDSNAPIIPWVVYEYADAIMFRVWTNRGNTKERWIGSMTFVI